MNDLPEDEELYTIVLQGDPLNELDTRLKYLVHVDEALQNLYIRGNEYVTLLMVAALSGNDKITRIILSHSTNLGDLVDIQGCVIDMNGNPKTHVTALWCACHRSYFTVARTLIELGNANVNHGSDNPILISAIMDERYDIIQFLIENNYANIDETVERDRLNYNGLMIAAARGQTKMVRYLLEIGADIDYASSSYLTALGCAAMHGHLETVEFLCIAGASTNVKTDNEETPLTLAFQNGHIHVVDYLFDLTNDQLHIEDLELIASSIVVSMKRINNVQSQFDKMIHLMRKIFQLREKRNCRKLIDQPIDVYNSQQECQTIEEFERIQDDHQRLYIEALLIRERILFPKKMITLCEPLLIYGQNLVEQGEFDRCLHLWKHTFYLYQNMGHETSLHRFVWVFCKMIMAKIFISPQLFVQICRLTFEPSEQKKKNHSIKNSLCLIAIAAKVLEQAMLTKADRQLIYRLINDICRQQRTTTDGQTLLHLCVNEQTYRDINYRASEVKQVLSFPNLAATQLLLTYGNQWIDTEAIELYSGNTALHIVANSTKIEALAIAELLIQAGAHVDCLNKHNKTPFECAETMEMKSSLQKHQIPPLLKCLCARHIVTKQLNYESIWSTETKLNKFIYLHGVIGRQNHKDSV